MPRRCITFPRYRHHKARGLAVVSFGRGRDVYLGTWKSRVSRELYDQLIALWLQHGRTMPDDVLARFQTGEPEVDVHIDLSQPEPLSNLDSEPPAPASTGPPLSALTEAYNAHATEYYRKAGRSTREAEQIAEALKVAVDLFGAEPISQFGPLKLQLVRDKMIELGWSRPYINKQTGRIRRAFQWGVSRELVTSAVCGALKMVDGLKKGRTKAPETEKVLPVDRATVETTVGHLSSVVASMVRLQLETGMRPGEVRNLRPCDVDRSGEVWVYRPDSHKTEHQDKDRVVFIGPKGQDILRPYLLRGATEFCFSPADAVRKMRDQREADRQTPLSCGNRRGTNRKASPVRTAGRQYSKDSYNKAIRRACEAAGVEPWHPNRLRHTKATEIRAEFGIEASQVVLGHSNADVTQIYAERDQAKAREVMAQVG